AFEGLFLPRRWSMQSLDIPKRPQAFKDLPSQGRGVRSQQDEQPGTLTTHDLLHHHEKLLKVI
ncbi:hypothetical protein STEG23_009914, partial [Scotinomys teguina]